jgi:hypothetical protein
MNATEFANLSMSELKSICLDRGISVNGDRRLKASYINTIVAFGHQEETAAAPTTVIGDPFDEPIELPRSVPIAIGQNERCAILQGEATANESNHSHQPAIEPDIKRQLPSLHPYRNASIVLLIPLIITLALFLAVKTTITSLAWSSARLAPFLTRLWRSSIVDRNPIDSIDYFPSLA